jgi:hypothetical protein
MFGKFNKNEKDPQKALDQGRNSLNKGLSGGLTKMVMGKDFVNDMNAAMDQGQAAIDGVNQQQWLAQNGADATADVLAIQDTGALVNMNPVVVLSLNVQPAAGAAFQTAGQTMVSKIAIPRVGDKVKIKYNPANPTQFMVL